MSYAIKRGRGLVLTTKNVPLLFDTEQQAKTAARALDYKWEMSHGVTYRSHYRVVTYVV